MRGPEFSVFVAGVFGVRAGGTGRSSQMPGEAGAVGVGVRVAVGGGGCGRGCGGCAGDGLAISPLYVFAVFRIFANWKNVFMNRVKWILLGVCLFGMLIGAAVAYSGYVKKRLDADGAETRCGAHREFFTDRIRRIPARIPGADAPQFPGKAHRLLFQIPVQGGWGRLYRQGP